MNRLTLFAQTASVLCAFLMCSPAWPQEPAAAAPEQTAESIFSRPSRYFKEFKGFMTAPVDWDGREWARLGVVLAATNLAYQKDYKVREHFVPTPRPRDYHDVEDVMPAALAFGATWLAAKRTGEDDRFAEATTMVHAAALSTLSSLTFKLAHGRARPGPGVPRDGWHDGGRSFPSGHTAVAFAVGTVLAESGTPKRRWVRRVLGYGLGAGTLYLRLKHDTHWFSDTIPGAALGIAAGRYAISHGTPSSPRANFFVAPLDGGAMLTYSVSLAR